MDNLFAQFINTYGVPILYALLTALAGALANAIKALYTKYINDKTKQVVAKTAVQFVEQVYKDLHGDEKLGQALTAASEMLYEKGIAFTELEMRVLIEAAVGEFNNAFSKEAE